MPRYRSTDLIFNQTIFYSLSTFRTHSDMLYAILPDESYLSSKGVLKIENEKINVEFASTEAQRVSSTFLAKCQSTEGVVISSSPHFDEDVLKQLITGRVSGFFENFFWIFLLPSISLFDSSN